MKSKSVVFVREKETDLAYDVDVLDESGMSEMGPIYFSFDTEHIYNFWTDYPNKLTADQKWAFDDTFPYWAKFNVTEKEAEELAKAHPNWAEDNYEHFDFEECEDEDDDADGKAPCEEIIKDISEAIFITK